MVGCVEGLLCAGGLVLPVVAKRNELSAAAAPAGTPASPWGWAVGSIDGARSRKGWGGVCDGRGRDDDDGRRWGEVKQGKKEPEHYT